jgi:Flp pilus assembly protein TadG
MAVLVEDQKRLEVRLNMMLSELQEKSMEMQTSRICLADPVVAAATTVKVVREQAQSKSFPVVLSPLVETFGLVVAKVVPVPTRLVEAVVRVQVVPYTSKPPTL